MQSAKSFTTVFCTVPDDSTARLIANQLVEKKLAACCNIIPNLMSIYRWQGKIETDSELLLIIKTSFAALKEVEQLINELHPYEVPEIIALPIEQGNASYLQWLEQSIEDHHE